MAPVEDLAGAGRIVSSILDKVSSAIGVIYEPTRVRRLGRAEAYVEAIILRRRDETMRAIERARLSDAATPEGLRARAGARLIQQETIRQENIEATLSEAAEIADAREVEGAGPRDISDDWMEAFLRYAQDISAEDVRRLWATILANQATADAPAISKATLDGLRLIEAPQAAAFDRMIRLFASMNQIMDIAPHDEDGVNIHAMEALALEDIGFVRRQAEAEHSLDLGDVVLTFWAEHFQESGFLNGGWTKDWPTGDRGKGVDLIRKISASETPDTYQIKAAPRITSLILTSRGFELATILLDGFYDVLSACDRGDDPRLAPFAGAARRSEILLTWARVIASSGVVVVLNERTPPTNEVGDGETITRRGHTPRAMLTRSDPNWRNLDELEATP